MDIDWPDIIVGAVLSALVKPIFSILRKFVVRVWERLNPMMAQQRGFRIPFAAGAIGGILGGMISFAGIKWGVYFEGDLERLGWFIYYVNLLFLYTLVLAMLGWIWGFALFTSPKNIIGTVISILCAIVLDPEMQTINGETDFISQLFGYYQIASGVFFFWSLLFLAVETEVMDRANKRHGS